MHISKLPKLSESIFSTMSALANKHNAINLSQGFPNFKTSEKLQQLVTEAMQKGYNQYAPMRGDLELREVIAHKIFKSYQTKYDATNEITITAGATEALFNAITAFVHKDDEVIIFKPAFDSYEPVVRLNGGVPIFIQLNYPNYKVNWEEVADKISTKTRMIIINTPLNPTGTLFDKSDMLALQNIIKNTDIIVISDEVYEHMTYDGLTHQSACKYPILKEQSFVIASFGKTFHNTGWKMGYAAAPKHLMDEFVKVHEFNVFSINTPYQKAFAIFIQDENNYNYLNQFYQNKRDLFLKGIENSNFSYTPCKGTYFQLLKYNKITEENDVEFAKRLVKEFKIATIPISVFNTNQLDEKVLRFCFAKTDETIHKATEILCQIH
ncbi:methionine aminotransferase [Wenyingzhuangia marina]|uniref:Methionine aminotransferase n=1 Tax=Wenyingzhuangia marina TaxID=1195760 RepID=A0A1M5SLX3_9FLAO|nr:methionine aminotransferase [Wenyingzhuangia marina]GGF62676.1 aminotransferase [Wenyingzhuangia marina]SHH38903.1 methionine aminotransferase [Wenyingzhuangia marina]